MPRSKRSAINKMSVPELLSTHSQILDELRMRGVIRTLNSPVGDYAELLFQRAFGWRLNAKSTAGFDATDKKGRRYEIKCRRPTAQNKSTQLSPVRNFEKRKFDYLAGVILNPDYSVSRAIIIPRSKLRELRPRYSKHVNGWLYHLRPNAWKVRGARDVTEKLRAAATKL